ncbi:uncharacterized protein LOC121417807 [Lytechinus variegatus]|uniref:uncharacterized protein LOC121417807 n=1 Tax=Lytechinus variegatus TaxID=7654 RepID=UPI001BB28463|nr:uncharacterized protein LOC121417807 [Lytechinus variegatus]
MPRRTKRKAATAADTDDGNESTSSTSSVTRRQERTAAPQTEDSPAKHTRRQEHMKRSVSATAASSDVTESENVATTSAISPPVEIPRLTKKKTNVQQSAAPPPRNQSPSNSTESQEQEQPRFPQKETEFKTRKSMRRMLTQDEEDDLVTWLREHTFLYDKSSAQFKMREKKSRTWREKEDELDLNPGDLSSIWYLNMRTLFSRLIKTSRKSGSGAAERTARQEWILNKFEFIRPYLVQLRHQRGSNFAEKRKELAPEETDDDGDTASKSS